MTLDAFLELLEDVRNAGAGFQSRCPAHEDHQASLGIADGDDRILVTCRAGCNTEDVLDKLDLKLSDLFYKARTHDAESHDREPEAVYNYVDENGELLYEKFRYPGKKFAQRHKDPDHEKADQDGWVWSLSDVRRVLYQLPRVIETVAKGETVYLTEGEKDADRLIKEGKPAATSGAAGSWRPEFSEFFRGANVIIVADRDESGRNHANAVQKALEAVGATTWIVQAKTGKDASDHFDAGFTVEQFKWLRQNRRGVVTASELAEHARDRLSMTEEDLPGYQLIPGIDLTFRPGRMYVVAGYQSDGKSSLGIQGFRTLSELGVRAAYFTLEMSEIDLVNKLCAHKGVPSQYTENPWLLKGNAQMLTAYHEAVNEIETWQSEIIFDTTVNAAAIRERTIDREYEVVFVDHLHRIESKDRAHISDQVRQLNNIALEMNVLVIVLCQLRKTTRGQGFDIYPKPTMQDFRETSQIADDAAMALTVWRQRNADGVSFTGATEVIVLKNRYRTSKKDETGAFFIPKFDAERQMFVEGSV